jgi:hypothetical protein
MEGNALIAEPPKIYACITLMVMGVVLKKASKTTI